MQVELHQDSFRPCPTDSPRRFDPVTIAFHWTSAATVAAVFISIWSLALATNRDQAALILHLHRSLGALVWGVTIARMGWRLGFGLKPPLPRGTSWLQQRLAKLNEAALYLLLVAQPMTGLAQSLARGRSFYILGVNIPAIYERSRAVQSAFHAIHEISAWALLSLVGLHAAAALFHRFILRDGVLQSMWAAREIPQPLRITHRTEPL